MTEPQTSEQLLEFYLTLAFARHDLPGDGDGAGGEGEQQQGDRTQRPARQRDQRWHQLQTPQYR